ncbi:MAG TPA: caspase family protein [Gemmatimonadaceae bacterium]|nr:caspase family protein [Gemmatimonadaceae bacterium]
MSSKGMALTVGLNAVDPRAYEGWAGELVACEADARSMTAIARGAGFATTTLLTRRATRAAVLAGIHRAARLLKRGDIFLLTYSGHGGQVPDENGDEPDMEDETWCLYDGELLDDELFAAWSRFAAGVRILVTSDSCHSGSVTRARYATLGSRGATMAMTGLDDSVDGGGAMSDGGAAAARPRYRAMPTEVMFRTYYAHQKFYDDIGASIPKDVASRVKATVMLISGCHDNQLSSDGDFNGLFTSRLLQVWNGGKYAKDYRAFHRDIVKRMPPAQVPEYSVIGAANAAFEAQRPFTVAAPGTAHAPARRKAASPPKRGRRSTRRATAAR